MCDCSLYGINHVMISYFRQVCVLVKFDSAMFICLYFNVNSLSLVQYSYMYTGLGITFCNALHNNYYFYVEKVI